MIESSSVHLSVTSEPANLATVRAAVEETGRRLALCEQDICSLVLAVNEAVANVIQHGYEGRAGQPIEVTLEATGGDGQVTLRVIIQDRARQVDSAQIVGRDLEDFRPGGLGTHIIRAIMDEVEYRPRAGGGMTLRMVKRFPVAQGQA